MRHVLASLPVALSASAAVAVALSGVLMASAGSASAVPDPASTIGCLSASAGDITALVDPAAIGVPSEVPGTSCLAP